MTQTTVFHITHQKAGSQWIYQILNEIAPTRIITARMGEQQFTSQPIIPGMVYSPLYIDRMNFERVPVPTNHVKFFVIRDPRDTLISLYFSSKKSHVSSRRIALARPQLERLSFEDGLRLLMRYNMPRLIDIALSWLNAPETYWVRFEDLLSDQYTEFQRVLDYCEFGIRGEQLKQVLDKFSFERLSGRARGSEDESSHYRKGVPGDWKNYLKDSLLDEFNQLFGDALVSTGYESEVPASSEMPITVESNPESLNCWCSDHAPQPYSHRYARCPLCNTLITTSYAPEDAVAYLRFEPQFEFELSATERNTSNLSLLEKLLRYKSPGAHVLDYGSTTGDLAALLQQVGYHVTAIEADTNSREYAQRTFDLPVLPDHQTLEPQSFDAILFHGDRLTFQSRRSTFNQLDNPLAALERCRQLLKPDGILIAEVVVYDQTQTEISVERTDQRPMRLVRHLLHKYLFSRNTVTQLFERAGFNTVHTDQYFDYAREQFRDSKLWIIASPAALEPTAVGPFERLREAPGGLLAHSALSLLQYVHSVYDEHQLTRDQLGYLLTSNGTRPAHQLQQDVLTTGSGWHSVETYGQDTFCWISNDAELIVDSPSGDSKTLWLEIEPGPSLNALSFKLQLLDGQDQVIQTHQVNQRQIIHLSLPTKIGSSATFRLHVDSPNLPVPNDPRILNFRIFRFGWDSGAAATAHVNHSRQNFVKLGIRRLARHKRLMIE